MFIKCVLKRPFHPIRSLIRAGAQARGSARFSDNARQGRRFEGPGNQHMGISWVSIVMVVPLLMAGLYMENPWKSSEDGWFKGTPSLGNPHVGKAGKS